MLRVHPVPEAIEFCSELLLLIGALDKEPVDEPHNAGRFAGAREWCAANVVYVRAPQEADVVVLSRKFTSLVDPAFREALQAARNANRLLSIFFNDDREEAIVGLPERCILFRTSMRASNSTPRELPLAPTSPDFFQDYLPRDAPLRVSFCGQAGNGRARYLQLLANSVETDFVVRRGFWAPGVPRAQARAEYGRNMRGSLFCFCARGAGNFSYRLYECLSAGRVPVLIDSDCVIPHFHELREVAVVVSDYDASFNLVSAIRSFYASRDMLEMQKACRALWERRYSPRGALESMYSVLSRWAA